jgi:hypothetical protein
VLLAATVALMSVMDESALDALYRSVNTITTAGEMSPPKQTGGRLVTLLVLMSGVSIFLYVVGLTIELSWAAWFREPGKGGAWSRELPV